MAKKTTVPHRGRFMAQGGGINKTENWNRNTPLPYAEGKKLLANLESQLAPSEKKARLFGINLCYAEIAKMHAAGGFEPNGVFKESFPNGKEERIDLDIFKGKAFI